MFGLTGVSKWDSGRDGGFLVQIPEGRRAIKKGSSRLPFPGGIFSRVRLAHAAVTFSRCGGFVARAAVAGFPGEAVPGHGDLGADFGARIQVEDVLVEHADAAG